MSRSTKPGPCPLLLFSSFLFFFFFFSSFFFFFFFSFFFFFLLLLFFLSPSSSSSFFLLSVFFFFRFFLLFLLRKSKRGSVSTSALFSEVVALHTRKGTVLPQASSPATLASLSWVTVKSSTQYLTWYLRVRVDKHE